MRRLTIVLGLLGLICAVPAAQAADLYGGAAPYEAPLAPIWTGYYVGGHLGGVWKGDDSLGLEKHCKDSQKCRCRGCYDTEWRKVEMRKDFDEDKNDVNMIGGVQVGYNWQSGNYVFGLEGDASFSDDINYLASFRARIGIAADRFLIYATAGAAIAEFEKGSYDKFFKNSDQTQMGLVVGGGVEYMLASNVSIGVEGLYYAFGDDEDFKTWSKGCKEYRLTHKEDDDLFVVRARLSYHIQPAYEEPLK